MRLVIKLPHLQVMSTATRIPTGREKKNKWGRGNKNKKKKRITPISALLNRPPEIDLLITNKGVHVFLEGFFPRHIPLFVHVLTNVAVLSFPQKQIEAKKRQNVCCLSPGSPYITFMLKSVSVSLPFAVFIIKTCLS